MRKQLDQKLQAFYLRNMPGMNTRKETLEQDANYVEKAQNARFQQEYGSVKKREPLRYYNSTAKSTEAVDGVFRYYTSDGFTKLIMITDGVAYVGDDSAGTFTAIRTLSTSGKRAAFKVYKDLLIVGDGYNNTWVYDGSSDNVTWELGSCKAFLGSAGGQLDASSDYYYSVGLTYGGTEYIFGAVSNTVSTDATYKQIDLTNIPLGPVGSTSRQIYRTEGDGSTLKLIHTLSDNTTEEWTDTAADGGTLSSVADAGGGDVTLTMSAAHGLQIGDRITIAGTTDYNGSYTVVTVPSTTTITITVAFVSDQSGTWAMGEDMGSVTDTPPKGSIMQIHRERLFISGDPDAPNAIYYSKPYLPHFMAHTTDLDVMKVDENDNDEIMGIPIHLGTMLCIKKNTIRRLHITGPTSGWDSSQWYAEDPHVHTGSPAQWSIVSTPYGVIYLGWDQWYIYTNQTEPIFTEFDPMDIAEERYSQTVGFWNKEIFYAAYTDSAAANSYHDRVMVYDFKQKKLAFDTMDVNCFTSYSGDDERGDLVMGSSRTGTAYKAEQSIERYRLYTKDGCDDGSVSNVFIGEQSGNPYMELGTSQSAVEIPDDVCIFWDNESTTPGTGWSEVSLKQADEYESGTFEFTGSTITDSDEEFLNKNYTAGQMLTVRGSKSNDGTYEIQSVAKGTITLTTAVTAEVCTGSITGVAYAHNPAQTYATEQQEFTTSAAHGLSVGDAITITDTANYDGDYYIDDVRTATTFTITVAWVSTETGTWQRKVQLSTPQPFIKFDETNDPGTLSGTDLHTHDLSGTTVAAYGALSNVGNAGSGTAFRDSHTHTVSITSAEGIAVPRHFKLRLFKKNNTTTEYVLPLGSICLWDGATAPGGWQGIASTYDGYYARLGKVNLLVTQSAAHSHPIVGLTDAYSGSGTTCDPHGSLSTTTDHVHLITGSTDTETPDWEEDYVEFRFIKRVGDEDNWDGTARYIYCLFYAAQATAASNGFAEVTSTYTGRLLKAGNGAIDLGSAQDGEHTHTVQQLETEYAGVRYGGGGDQQQAGGTHSHSILFDETEETDPSAPPSMAFRLVRKIYGQSSDYNDASSVTYTNGIWTSPAIQVSAESFGSWYWNETLIGVDNIEIFSRTAATSAVSTGTTITTVDHTTETFTLASHGLTDGDRITIGGTVLPTGLSDAIMYYVVGVAGNDFQVSLTSGGSAAAFTSNGTDVTFKSWDGPHSEPNGTPALSTPSTWMQYCVVFTAVDTTITNPRIYFSDQYIVKLEYVRGSTIAETSVPFIYQVGFRNFMLPSIDKIFKKLILVHEVEASLPGSVVISWETENASNSFTVDLDSNRLKWESFFQSTAMGRRLDFTFTKDDLVNYTLKEVQGVYTNLPLIA